jgi:hypothetical protein
MTSTAAQAPDVSDNPAMASSLKAAKQQLRALMKQRLSNISQESVAFQSTKHTPPLAAALVPGNQPSGFAH